MANFCLVFTNLGLVVSLLLPLAAFAASGQGSDRVVKYDERGFPAGGILPAPPPVPEEAKGQLRDQARVDSQHQVEINRYDEQCTSVRNLYSQHVFIPLGTRYEWELFKAHRPEQILIRNCELEAAEEAEPIPEYEVVEKCSTKTHKVAEIPVNFPNPAKACDWGNGGNLEVKNDYFQGRIEQEIGLDIPKAATMCDASFEFVAQKFWYDDVFVITIDNNVVVSSYDWDGVLPKENGFFQYDWEKIAGTDWDHWDKSEDYCPKDEDLHKNNDYEKIINDYQNELAQLRKDLVDAQANNGRVGDDDDDDDKDKGKGKGKKLTSVKDIQQRIAVVEKSIAYYQAKASEVPPISTCKIPRQHQVAPLELDLSSNMIQKAMSNSGYLTHKMKFITLGDNDDSDCQHFDVQLTLRVTYVE